MPRRRTPLLVALAALSVVTACGDSSEGSKSSTRLDARSLVAQPHDVGGVREVGGSWLELGDDGVYPLADALGQTTVPRNIAFLAGYPGVAGRALGSTVVAMAVVLPRKAAAARLLRDTVRVSGFANARIDTASAVAPPGSGDAAVAGTGDQPGGSPAPLAVIAWTKGRLYGYVSATGPGARALVARIAAVEEGRFERALDGDRLSFDVTLEPRVPIGRNASPPKIRTVHPTAGVPRIERPGRYTLSDLGAGRLTFSPEAGEDGIQFPVALALPASPRGRWLWRITTHVIVTLAARAEPGHLQVSPRIARAGAPGAPFVVARDLSSGKTLLIDELKHTETTKSLEVSISAMVGMSPSPRQTALVGFTFGSYDDRRALGRVVVLPDSAIEVFDDPAEIGQSAIALGISRALP